MKFLSLEIEDFGLFAGTHRFKLVPEESDGNQPVILIGGKNGAGKTTFLEALRTCLYGKQAFGERLGHKRYLQSLADRIHRPADESKTVNGSRLTLVFEYAIEGVSREYEVTRRWTRTSNAQAPVQEQLNIMVDGETLTEIAEDYWGDFIEELVPFGVSELFFFDGEKIKSMAENATANESLGTAMKSMLGLDLIERLQADLSLYRTRRIKAGSSGDARKAITSAETEVQELSGQIDLKRQAIAETEAQLDTAKHKLQLAETDLKTHGGQLAENRDSNKEQKLALMERHNALASEGRRLMEGVLPFAFCPNVTRRLFSQIDAEAEGRRAEALKTELDALGDYLCKTLAADSTLPSEARLSVAMKAKTLVDQYAEGKPAHTTLHDLSERLAQLFRTWTTTAQTSVAARVSELTEELRKTENAQQNIERALVQAPKDDAVADVVQRLAAATSEVTLLEAKVLAQRDELQQLENKLAHANRTLEKALQLSQDQEGQANRIAMAERSIKAMQAYQAGLTKARISTLEDNISARFRSLLRKDDLVSQVHVDPQSFNVTISGQMGRGLKRDELSAGEKQIYAIATLWGLADTSGRPLPMVVDTPLGRLDSEHRSNLIHHYFPKVSHQVIILSTDTEVDEQLYEELSPYVGKAFLFQSEGGQTQVSEEYFWQGGTA